MIYFFIMFFLFSNTNNLKSKDLGTIIKNEATKLDLTNIEEQKTRIDEKVKEPKEKLKVDFIKQEVEIEKDKDNLGIIKVTEIVNNCSTIKALENAKDDNTITLIDYKKLKDTLYTKMSVNFDYFKVSKDSLEYDFDPITKKYKKHHWTGKSESEKNRFVNTFTDVVSSIVYPICANFFENNRVTHKVVSSTDTKIHIETKVYLKKKYALAEWFMAKTNNVWKIYDISIEEESWVASFRSQFTEVIEKKSYSELFDIMKERKQEVLDNRAKKKQKKEPEKNKK